MAVTFEVTIEKEKEELPYYMFLFCKSTTILNTCLSSQYVFRNVCYIQARINTFSKYIHKMLYTIERSNIYSFLYQKINDMINK